MKNKKNKRNKSNVLELWTRAVNTLKQKAYRNKAYQQLLDFLVELAKEPIALVKALFHKISLALTKLPLIKRWFKPSDLAVVAADKEETDQKAELVNHWAYKLARSKGGKGILYAALPVLYAAVAAGPVAVAVVKIGRKLKQKLKRRKA